MSSLRQAVLSSALEPASFPEPGVSKRVFRFGAAFPGFQGHFPEFPILPAVVQVLTAVMVAETLLARRLALSSLENAKFLLQIGPEQNVSVQCSRRDTPSGPSVETRIHVQEGLAASFRLVFEEAQELG